MLPGTGHRHAPLRGKLDGVAEKIHEDLLHPTLVSHHLSHIVADVTEDVEALLVGRGGDALHGTLHHGGQGKGLLGEDHSSRLDLGDVQYVVDEGQKMAGAPLHHLHLLGLFLVQRARQPLEQDAGEPDDGVERRAQLVGHGGEKGGLEAIGGFRLGLRPQEVGIGGLQFAGPLPHQIFQTLAIALQLFLRPDFFGDVAHQMNEPREAAFVVADGVHRDPESTIVGGHGGGAAPERFPGDAQRAVVEGFMAVVGHFPARKPRDLLVVLGKKALRGLVGVQDCAVQVQHPDGVLDRVEGGAPLAPRSAQLVHQSPKLLGLGVHQPVQPQHAQHGKKGHRQRCPPRHREPEGHFSGKLFGGPPPEGREVHRVGVLLKARQVPVQSFQQSGVPLLGGGEIYPGGAENHRRVFQGVLLADQRGAETVGHHRVGAPPRHGVKGVGEGGEGDEGDGDAEILHDLLEGVLLHGAFQDRHPLGLQVQNGMDFRQGMGEELKPVGDHGLMVKGVKVSPFAVVGHVRHEVDLPRGQAGEALPPGARDIVQSPVFLLGDGFEDVREDPLGGAGGSGEDLGTVFVNPHPDALGRFGGAPQEADHEQGSGESEPPGEGTRPSLTCWPQGHRLPLKSCGARVVSKRARRPASVLWRALKKPPPLPVDVFQEQCPGGKR